MDKFAVVKIGSQQFKVSEGEELEVEKIAGEKGKEVIFEEVLLLADKKIEIGQPLVRGARVEAKILNQSKGEKIRVAKFRAKSRYRRVKGFRPLLTKIKIEKIVVPSSVKSRG